MAEKETYKEYYVCMLYFQDGTGAKVKIEVECWIQEEHKAIQMSLPATRDFLSLLLL